MSGSWEIKQQNSVLCAILHVDATTVSWSLGLRNLRLPGHIICLAGMPYDHSRNQAVEVMLEQGFTWLFFLDSDVIPPSDAVLKLMSRNAPIISGLYTRRSPPHGIPVMIRNGQWVTDFPMGSVVEVDLVGAGCLLVHRSVFESLPPQRPEAGKTWFDWRVDCQKVKGPDGKELYQHGDCLSEDFTFCKWAKERGGYKILVDTSVQCRHVGHAESKYGSFLPLETHSNT